MLGHSRMVALSQVQDCLERGWIVVVPNHRLCPGVDLLNGPMQDIRDLLAWIYDGHLDAVLKSQEMYHVDLENVAAFGTSSGGTLALGLVCSFLFLHFYLLKKMKSLMVKTNTNTGIQCPQTRQSNPLSVRRSPLHPSILDHPPPPNCNQTP